ncbi:hypothetical protein, partial [Prevotella sp.]|uniref:hypothetical protein n=1 Tax=Prevotella sp. TaxID=59823 RepID=UPI0025FFE0C4
MVEKKHKEVDSRHKQSGLKAQQAHSPGRCPTLYTHLLFFEIIGILYICQMKSSPFTSLTFN